MKSFLVFRTVEQAQKAVMLLLVSNIFFGVIATGAALKTFVSKEDIALVPPGLSEKVQLGWNGASPDYLKAWGLYFVLSVTNLTPRSVNFIADQLASYVAPEIYPDVRRNLQKAAAEPAFVAAGTASKFEAENVLYEPSTGKVFVYGNMLIRDTAGRDETKPLTYELVIQIRDRRPWVTYIDSYPGREARTQQWLRNHPDFKPEGANKK